MNPVFYTVKEVAKKLDTKEDTVRRWIFDKKLKTSITSKKSGHMISPDELAKFLKSHPKYAAKYVGVTSVSPVAIGALMAGLLGGLMALASSQKDGRVTADDVKHSMDAKIDALKQQIAEEKAMLEKLTAKIEANQKTLDSYLMMAAQLDADVVAEQINTNIQNAKEELHEHE